ncbi:hypothetical protein GCM10027405_14120 [Arthrobacter alkaliphilus]
MDGIQGTERIGTGALSGCAVLDAAVLGAAVPGAVVTGAEFEDLTRAVASFRPGSDSAELISQLRALEDLKSAAAAAQARIAVAFDTAQRRADAAAGVPAEGRGRGVAA